MPKKRAASPSRSPVAKRKRTAKATSTDPKATAALKKTTASKTTAPKATAPKRIAPKPTAPKVQTPKATVPKTSPPQAPVRPNSRPAGRSVSSGPPRPDRRTPGSVERYVIARPPLQSNEQGASKASSHQPKDHDNPKPPTRVKVPELQMPRAYFNPIRKKEELQHLRECDDCGAQYNCKTESGDCYYHPGELVIDDEAPWLYRMGLHLDDPEELQWIKDNVEWYRDDKFERGFIWDCCGESRYDKGCEAQSHVPGSWRYEE